MVAIKSPHTGRVALSKAEKEEEGDDDDDDDDDDNNALNRMVFKACISDFTTGKSGSGSNSSSSL